MRYNDQHIIITLDIYTITKIEYFESINRDGKCTRYCNVNTND